MLNGWCNMVLSYLISFLSIGVVNLQWRWSFIVQILQYSWFQYCIVQFLQDCTVLSVHKDSKKKMKKNLRILQNFYQNHPKSFETLLRIFWDCSKTTVRLLQNTFKIFWRITFSENHSEISRSLLLQWSKSAKRLLCDSSWIF